MEVEVEVEVEERAGASDSTPQNRYHTCRPSPLRKIDVAVHVRSSNICDVRGSLHCLAEPKRGIEPLTYALRVRCSTD